MCLVAAEILLCLLVFSHSTIASLLCSPHKDHKIQQQCSMVRVRGFASVMLMENIFDYISACLT